MIKRNLMDLNTLKQGFLKLLLNDLRLIFIQGQRLIGDNKVILNQLINVTSFCHWASTKLMQTSLRQKRRHILYLQFKR